VTPRKEKESKDTDLDELLNSIASDIGFPTIVEEEKSSEVFNDIDKIIASTNTDVIEGVNDDDLEFILQGAFDHDKKSRGRKK